MMQVTAQLQQQKAQLHILRDLVDSMLCEDIFELWSKSRLEQTPSATILHYQQAAQTLSIPVYLSGLNTYRLASDTVVLHSKTAQHIADAVTLWQALVSMNAARCDNLNVQRFAEGLMTAEQQLADQLTHLTLADNTFIQAEQLASLKDRPFHPLAKEKRGLSETDYKRYQAEYCQSFALQTVAIHRDYLIAGDVAEEAALMETLGLTDIQVKQLLREHEVTAADYMVFPVHPWQWEHIIRPMFQGELATGVIVPLNYKFGNYVSSSSIRSLIDVQDPFHHLKVPFAMQSLGALRLTPTRYLLNGEKAEGLLRQVIAQDKNLADTVTLCNERQWWSFMQADGDIFADKIGHLTAQLRSYPESVMADHTQLVSMAALAAHDTKLYALIIDKPVKEITQDDVLALFDDIVAHFIQTVMTFMQYGVLPEVHGQNVLLSFQEGHVQQCVLRDHDTVRIYPPLMQANDINIPEYTISQNSPNTLINDDLATFFTYFQTLGVSVNLYAIVDALHHTFNIKEAQLMTRIKHAMKQQVETLNFAPDTKQQITTLLFTADTWPFKRILLPLLQQQGSGGGSMPSSIGTIANPMKRYD